MDRRDCRSVISIRKSKIWLWVGSVSRVWVQLGKGLEIKISAVAVLYIENYCCKDLRWMSTDRL